MAFRISGYRDRTQEREKYAGWEGLLAFVAEANQGKYAKTKD
jgi:hypothetical protein